MLSARYLASCTDDLVKLLSELETEIVSDMARRFIKLGKVTESSEYQARILAEIGGLKEDVIKLMMNVSYYYSPNLNILGFLLQIV